MRLQATFLCLLFYTSLAFSADIRIADLSTLEITGEIVPGDFLKFKEAAAIILRGQVELNKTRGDPEWLASSRVIINSPGGSLDEAMKIGHLARKNSFAVTITSDGRCFSSCIFIYAGGVLRGVARSRLRTTSPPSDSQLGIHRPYFRSLEGNMSIDHELKKLIDASRKYFKQMNVKPELAEDIFSIEPEDIKFLNSEELESYRLGSVDLAYRERAVHWLMGKYGMTREQFMSAQQSFSNDQSNFCSYLEKQHHQIECMKYYRNQHGLFYIEDGRTYYPGLE